jgi:hypothetical protein
LQMTYIMTHTNRTKNISVEGNFCVSGIKPSYFLRLLASHYQAM